MYGFERFLATCNLLWQEVTLKPKLQDVFDKKDKDFYILGYEFQKSYNQNSKEYQKCVRANLQYKNNLRNDRDPPEEKYVAEVDTVNQVEEKVQVNSKYELDQSMDELESSEDENYIEHMDESKEQFSLELGVISEDTKSSASDLTEIINFNDGDVVEVLFVFSSILVSFLLTRCLNRLCMKKCCLKSSLKKMFQ